MRVIPARVELPAGAPAAETQEQIGWQLFDRSTGLWIAEGGWGTPASALDVHLPEADGEYRVYISLRDEDRGWRYARGLKFVVVDAGVRQGRLTLTAPRVSTLRRLRIEALPGRLGAALVRPFVALWRHRALIGTLVRRDLRARYRGSFFGSLWAVLQPLLQMALYYFVFGEVLKARFPGDPTREGFALYFMAGMLPWLAMTEALGRAPGVLAEHRNLIQKLVFPVEALPVSLVGAGLAASGFGLAVLLAFVAALRGGIPAGVAWLPVVLIPQVLLTLGLAWLLAALGAYLRDLSQVIGFLLTLWFFLTPICYPDTAELPRVLRDANPVYALVRGYRRVLLEGAAPDLWWLAQWTAVAVAVLWVGSAAFERLKRGLADAL